MLLSLDDILLGQIVVNTPRPCTVRTYDAPKVRFSATLGQKPEVEVGLA
jgi:hypothetical protein